MCNNKKKVYRFALYGLSGSGKTCVLTALAMPRYPHPLGYSCLWRTINAADEESKPYRSQKWMQEAIHKLSEQELPSANPTGEDFIFEYDFTASTHQTFCIELVDYSGELINPNISQSAVAKNLRQKFTELDGILVLADAPFHDKVVHDHAYCGKQAYADLYSLEQAFSLLRDETQKGMAALDVPLALVITKWDRYSDIDYANPAYELSKLEELFNSKPQVPHKGLSDVLRFSVTKDNFNVFPVSALGTTECVQVDNGKFVERPIQVNPINAFGLENAFLWLAQRRDAIDLQEFKMQAVKNSKKIGLELLNRFPKTSLEAKQINTRLQEYQKTKKNRMIYFMISIVVLCFLVEAIIDMNNYRQYQYSIGTNSTHEELEKAGTWFNKYITASDFRHLISKFFLKREEAQLSLTQLQAHRDQSLWIPIEKSMKVNLQAAFVPALEYLKYFPNGRHAQEALEIKLQAELQQQHWVNEEALAKLKNAVQKPNPNLNQLKNFLNSLNHLPLHPQAETPELQTQRLALEKQLLEQILELTKEENWGQFCEDYEKKMQAGDFLAAAQSLEIYQSDARLNNLKTTFKIDVLIAIEEGVIQAFKDDNYSEAYALVRDYEQLPSELQTNEGKNKIAALQRQVKEMRDEDLYQAVKKHKTVFQMMRYLQEAPLQTMAKEVSAYKREYLDRLEQKTKQEFKLKLVQIRWVNVNDYDNVVRVYLDSKQVIYNQNVDAKPNFSTELIGIGAFNAKYDDFITIEIGIINEDMFFDDDYGKGKVEKKLSDLVNDFSILLVSRAGVQTGTAFFEISGYPQAPVLPAWRSEK